MTDRITKPRLERALAALNETSNMYAIFDDTGLKCSGEEFDKALLMGTLDALIAEEVEEPCGRRYSIKVRAAGQPAGWREEGGTA